MELNLTCRCGRIIEGFDEFEVEVSDDEFELILNEIRQNADAIETIN